MSNIEVHARHCCVLHGCKYGDDDCPVEKGHVEQEYICEQCAEAEISTVEEVKDIVSKRDNWEEDRQKLVIKLSSYDLWLLGYRKLDERY